MSSTRYCFLFVRYDLPVEQQIIQTNHSTFEMAYTLTQSIEPICPSIVLVGVPNKKALLKVIEKLKLNRIEFSVFDEPDHDLGITAVATVPLDAGQKEVLRKYKLWNEKEFLHTASSVVRAPSSQEDGGRWFESGAAYQGAASSAMQEV